MMQYAVVTEDDPVSAKEGLITSEFEGVALPDFTDVSEPHAALSRFPLPVYITTNFDSLMVKALTAQGREPRQVICPWYPGAPFNKKDSVLHKGQDRPIVYHLHGHAGVPRSLVVTEDDYVEFLAALVVEGDARRGAEAPATVDPGVSGHNAAALRRLQPQRLDVPGDLPLAGAEPPKHPSAPPRQRAAEAASR